MIRFWLHRLGLCRRRRRGQPFMIRSVLAARHRWGLTRPVEPRPEDLRKAIKGECDGSSP